MKVIDNIVMLYPHQKRSIMQFAYDYNDERVFIEDTHSNQEYYCPYCGAPLITKKGEIRQHHFAHKSTHLCSDTWERTGTYDKTPWHNDWQNNFPRNNQEVKLQLGGTIHRADVMVGRTVVEFQHSIMPVKNFDDRNNFYFNLGYKVVWLFDLTGLLEKKQLTYEKRKQGLIFHWKNPKRVFNSYDIQSGCIDLFFQINSRDNLCIVQVTDISPKGFELFYTTAPMSKSDFLEYVGLVQGQCSEPERHDIDSNQEYLEFKEKYHIVLNKQQERALQSIEGANLLLAVPGSGKTTVLVERLGFMLLVKKIPAENILALTFNKQAAVEMKKRFSDQFGEELAEQIQFRTIHSFAYEIYRTCRDSENRKRLDLIHGKEKRALIRDVLQKVYPDSRVTENSILDVQTIVTYIKNMMLTSDQIKALDTDSEKWSEIYKTYEVIRKQKKKMDYDDQLVFANAVLEKRPEILSELRKKYQYICVDEAQDTSKIQHCIIQKLAVGNNLFMVGDEDQSIYGFRAAYPKALLNFRYDYKNPYIMRMERNYRSTSQIIEKAQQFISQNKGRYEKSMVSERGPGEEVQVVRLKDRISQYQYLTEIAKSNHSETAFLYRDNESGAVLADLLLRNNIPFTLKKPEMNFFGTKTFRDIVAYLTLALDPSDVDSFNQIVNKGILYLKKDVKDEINRLCLHQSITVFDALVKVQKENSQSITEQIDDFLDIMHSLAAMEPAQAIDRLFQYGYSNEHNVNIESLELIRLMAAQEKTIPGFLEHVSSLENDFKKGFSSADENAIVLSTIHSSKGLEYDTVYMVDIYDGRFPSAQPDVLHRSKDNSNEEQEERRLFYVGMTRAKNKLVLIKLMDRPSTFIDSLFPESTPRGKVFGKPVFSYTNTSAGNDSLHHFSPTANVLTAIKKQPEIQKPMLSKEEEERICYEEVNCKFVQQQEQIHDHIGRRWIKCELCGKIKLESEFSIYGGLNKVNLGKCRDCCLQMK